MGPSGCGKTSMLSVLSGRASYGKTTGYVKINGKRSNISKFKKIVGFVPQEDIMIRVLTVEEILEYSAYTRVSSSISNNDLVSHIEEVIQLLSLDKIRDSVIGDEDVRGISGGQRKRVNIAMEWVASPGMLFLDEPTSGLDSTSSIEVCQVLRNLAHNAGLTIVAVIHQPRYEIFQMFDDIAFLGVGGRPVYLGPTSEVAAYFKVLGYTCPPNLNPADYYLDVVSGIYGPPTPSLLSITDLTTCQMLQEFWEQETQRKKASKRSSLAPSIAPINPDESSVSLDDGSILLNPVENKTTPPPNPLTEFVVAFLICLVIPWSLIGFETDKGKKLSVYSKFGGIFGVLLTPILICPPFIRRVKLGSLIVLLLLIISLCVAGILANLYAFFKYHKNNRDPAFSRLFMLGILYGPFSVLIGIFVLKGNRKLMAALSAGTLFLILVALVIAAPILYELNYPTNANWKFLTVTGLSNASFFVFSRVVTYIYRYLNVSLVERETRGILFLTFMAAKREFIVQMRNWKEILFHIIQITFGGLFLGFIFYDRPYKGPVFSFMSGECPTDTPLDILKSLCYFLLIPVDDPILAISSLSTLTIALCAVSYAISIFGKEVTVFKRESSTGGNTGAYYIGKSLAHLPMTLFAPVCYLLAFCGLGYLKADWSWHYIILTLTYASFTGVGYAISLLTPPRVSQLAGIFFVLVLMMFSGGQPTLKQLLNNELVGFALYVPTYFSYTRWANELVYLWEIKQYTADYRSMQALYGYYMYDELYCLGAMFSFFLFFRVITYIALVVKEHK
uniref:ABC transporter domain-containing protein n=1 Tax=Arcella intermedia TaxID=1963864 RepID=A0A6B2KXT8_9EUKA